MENIYQKEHRDATTFRRISVQYPKLYNSVSTYHFSEGRKSAAK